MSRLILLSVYISLYIGLNEGARILAVFPTPSISHQFVVRPLTQELVRRGHEVVVITTDPAFPKGQTPVNLTEVDVHDLSYRVWRDNILSASEQKDDIYSQISNVLDVNIKIAKEQFLSQELRELMKYKNTYFDLLLLEICSISTLAYSYLFKAPVVLVSPFGAVSSYNYIVGAPSYPPMLYPSVLRQRVHNLTSWEKVKEFYTGFNMERVHADHEEKSNLMLRKIIGPDIPTLNELGNNVDMMIYNMHPFWQGNYPVPPSVIYTGGLHLTPPKELPEELKSYLDSSVNGIIFVSFGTNIKGSLIPQKTIEAMIKVFSQLPYDILLKWDKNELLGKTTNIRIFKWLPQADLLKHPKVKLFITQAGLQSTDEAIAAGVPLVGIPMLADQWFNAEKYVYHKIGLKYDLETLSEDTFTTAINTVIMDGSYRRNVAKLRALMLDQPQRPLERAVWWTEHVLRHGGARHLRAPAANMSWSEYLELELIFIVVASLMSLFIIFSAFVYFLVYSIKKKCKGHLKVE